MRPTGVPGQLVVLFLSSAGRDALLPDSARAYDVTDQVQCLETSPTSPVTECDTSSPDLWTDAPNLYTTGQVVSGLLPNTDYTCFASATYVKDGVTTYTCAAAEASENDDVVLLPPAPPTTISVDNGLPPSSSIVVSATAPTGNGNAQPIPGYAVQCLDASSSVPTACDVDGTWSSIVDDTVLGTGVSFGSLSADTSYVCFAATVYGASGSEKYSCSAASGPISTTAGAPGAVTVTQTAEVDELKVDASASRMASIIAAVPADARSLIAYKVQCLLDSQGAPVTECDPSDPALWTDAPDLLTDGQIVDGLTPNTLYSCFAAATYVDANSQTQYLCSEVNDIPGGSVAATPVEGPAIVSAAAGTSPTEIVVTATPASQGTAETLTNVVQCLVGTVASCDSSANSPWTVGDPTSGQTVGSLLPNTVYSCFAAVRYGGVGAYQYVCSDAAPATTDIAAPAASAAATSATQIDVTVTPVVPQGSAAGTLSYAVQCVASGSTAPCGPGATGWTTVSDTAIAEPLTVLGNTAYDCYSAAVYNDGSNTNYVCSTASAVSTPS